MSRLTTLLKPKIRYPAICLIRHGRRCPPYPLRRR